MKSAVLMVTVDSLTVDSCSPFRHSLSRWIFMARKADCGPLYLDEYEHDWQQPGGYRVFNSKAQLLRIDQSLENSTRQTPMFGAQLDETQHNFLYDVNCLLESIHQTLLYRDIPSF